jgi:hypothetical protein
MSKIALSFALFLGAASAAFAAPRHPIDHRGGAAVRPAGAQVRGISAYGYVAPFQVSQPIGWPSYVPTCGNGLCP